MYYKDTISTQSIDILEIIFTRRISDASIKRGCRTGGYWLGSRAIVSYRHVTLDAY